MRNDHVFYGHIGGRYPTAEEIEHSMREAHRLRAETAHSLLRDFVRWVGAAFRRRPAPKLQHC